MPALAASAPSVASLTLPAHPVISADVEAGRRLVAAVRASVGRAVVGQDVVVERMLIALFTGGHLLLQGMPGLAKTLMVNSLAKAVALQFARVQFTIDLLPADIVGSEILDQASGTFRVRQGPVFTNLLLADEINRAAPKVQSALLEAMQERKVTIGSTSFKLPAPFLVIATQNPVEHAGTFELPEAQLDRFMLCHRLGYPTAEQESEVLKRQLGFGLSDHGGGAVPKNAFDVLEGGTSSGVEDLSAAMRAVLGVHVSEVFLAHTVELVRRTRSCPDFEFGASPRAGIALTQAARARAFIHGRDHTIPDDLFALAEDVMLHRLRMTYEAVADGRQAAQILQQLLVRVG